jgi:hypothetical protein
MPRSRKKPSSDSDTSTKRKASATGDSLQCSTSDETPSSRSADTSAEPKSLVPGGARRPGKPKEPISRDILEGLLRWIAEGKTLREWCRQPGNPHFTTVYDWINANEALILRFARAREDGYEAIAEECRTLADTPPHDQVEVQWRRLQIDTRLKLLAKWSPNKYGDKVGIDHGGSVTINVVTGLPDD